MNVLLIPVGSHGDVHPFLGIGQEMLRRGHRVTMLTNGLFEPLARKVGLRFVPVGTAEEFKQIIADPELWHVSRGWKTVFSNTVSNLMPRQYDAIRSCVIPGETVMVGGTLAFGARVLRDETGIPLATVHLQPSIFRSLYETPKLPGVPPLGWAPKWLKQGVFNVADNYVLDPFIAPPLNAFRATKGLGPVSMITRDWWHSPDRVIGLFPDWFAPAQPDWPEQTRLTGFPMFDERGLEPLPANLLKFLDAGPPPVAVTPGSAMSHGQTFFRAAIDGCVRAGRRAVLLTRHPENIPANLPPGVIHIPYAPFGELLPRCAAIIHHGGIGTLSQAMSAGVPQLIQPMSHDQPDNASRIKKLGIGDALPVRKFTASRIAKNLRRLIDSPDVAAQCRAVAARFAGANALGQTCDMVEQLA